MKLSLAALTAALIVAAIGWYFSHENGATLQRMQQSSHPTPETISYDIVKGARIHVPKRTCPVGYSPDHAIFVVEGTSSSRRAVVTNPNYSPDGLSTIHIQPGDDPVTLIVASYQNMLWLIEGDTARVRRVIVEPSYSATHGVIGVPTGRITFVERGVCIGGKREFLDRRAQYSRSERRTAPWYIRAELIDVPDLAFVAVPRNGEPSFEDLNERPTAYVEYDSIVFPETAP